MAIEACTTTTAPAIVPDWREGLPVIRGDGITLRELRLSDAVSTLSLLTAEEVTRFISPPPTTSRDSSASSGGPGTSAKRGGTRVSWRYPTVTTPQSGLPDSTAR